MDDLQELRAALIQIQKGQERQLEGTKRIIAWIGKRMDAAKDATVEVADCINATVAGVTGYNIGTEKG